MVKLFPVLLHYEGCSLSTFALLDDGSEHSMLFLLASEKIFLYSWLWGCLHSGLALLQSPPGWNGPSRVGWRDVLLPQVEYPEMETLSARADAIKQSCMEPHTRACRRGDAGVRQSTWPVLLSGEEGLDPPRLTEPFIWIQPCYAHLGAAAWKVIFIQSPTSSFQGSEVVTLKQESTTPENPAVQSFLIFPFFSPFHLWRLSSVSKVVLCLELGFFLLWHEC